MSKTGGGGDTPRSLSVQEERLMGIVGQTGVKGDGNLEATGIVPEPSTTAVEIQSSSANQPLSYEIILLDRETEEVVLNTPSVNVTTAIPMTSEPVTTPSTSVKRHSEQQPKNKSRRRSDSTSTSTAILEQMQSETLQALAEIKESIDNNTKALFEIRETMKMLVTVLENK